MNERSAEGDWREPVPPRLDAPVAATLSEEAFAEHLRRALRTLGDPLLLAQSPLVHAAFVQAAAPPGASPPERAACLRRLLHDEIETIRTLGGDNGWYRVLHAAYVRPGTKHEAAARSLALSYAAFRRRLGAATRHLVATFWERDTRQG